MGRTEEVSAAIADETEITAIEEAGIIAQSKSAEADDNPADRRLPLIARIYGIVMLVEGVVTLPIIVISCLYAVHAALSGKLAFGALNLTTILSVIHAAVLLVSTACLAIFGMLLILNKRRHIAQWTYLMIPLTLAEGLLSLSLQGLGVNLIRSCSCLYWLRCISRLIRRCARSDVCSSRFVVWMRAASMRRLFRRAWPAVI